jgi:hypothetical protein
MTTQPDDPVALLRLPPMTAPGDADVKEEAIA